MESDIWKNYKVNIKIAQFFEVSNDGLIDTKELNPNITHIMIFDDVMLNDQTKIKEYFCKGRHNNVNIF